MAVDSLARRLAAAALENKLDKSKGEALESNVELLKCYLEKVTVFLPL